MSGSAEEYLYQTQEQQYYKESHSHLDHVCQLDIDRNPAYIRQTNIICTIGDSSDTEEKLKLLIENGMNIARLNLTLGSYSYYSKIIRTIRRLETEMSSACIAIAVDLVAPTVRTGLVNNDVHAEVEVKEGQHISLTTDDKFKNDCSAENIWVDSTFFKNLIPTMKIGDRIFIDDGALIVIVRETGIDHARCLVEQGGRLGGSKRCILPRKALFRNSFSQSFRQNLLFALENQVDMIFSSFTDSKADVQRIREVLGPIGRGIKIVAKIETKAGITNIAELLEEADAIMIGRGDLGLELPIEKVFVAQKSIIARCQLSKKPVLVVTQMLESMRYKPRATRAEISDVANAVLDGADGLVLSVETARGMYPIETLQTMHRVCREAESAMFHRQLFLDLKVHESMQHLIDPTHTTAIAAVEASNKAKASCIIVVTTSGRSACLIASYRPQCPVITVTRQNQVARQCHLWRGLHPLLYNEDKADDWSEDMDLRISFAIDWGSKRGFLKAGDPVIIVTGWIAGTGSTNTVRVFYVPDQKNTKMHVVRSIQSLIDKGDQGALATAQGMHLDSTDSSGKLKVFDKSDMIYD